LALGIIIGLITGKADLISKSVVKAVDSPVQLVIGMIGMMCLWCGVMRVAEKSGLTDMLAKILRPMLKIIFRKAGKDNKALGAIVMNLTANMMGLSNAATPFGIKAMKEMQRLNHDKDRASDDMCLFLVLNAACIQIVPATVISVRAACNSQNSGIVIIPAIVATGTAAIVGVICCKILQRYF
jgi:spore maturation protein A